jgi:pantetheine-phosphate adenylyltransferase
VLDQPWKADQRRMRVTRCVYPGSFDPVTNGHVDVIERAANLFDEVVVAVLINPSKAATFTVDERLEILQHVTKEIPRTRVSSFEGLLVDFCRAEHIHVVVKGLRAVTDFDYELQMAQMNYRLSRVDTLFVASNPEYSFLSSSLIKEVAAYGGDVTGLLPPLVLTRLKEKLLGS